MPPLPVHRLSPLPSPAEPWSSLCVRAVHCHSQLFTLLCLCSTLTPQTWSVPGVVTALGPGLDLALQRWRSQALQQLQVSILWAFIQIHSMQWPQLPFLRSLRDSRDIIRGWDLGPLPRCLREDAGGPDPPSGPGHQAPGESSTSRPEPLPSPTEESSSPHLSPASRIRRPLFTRTPIPGNVHLRARDFHGESFYDVPALTADPRFRDSMRLITQYSLLPFMTPRKFYYPRVVLQFYHSMTS